MFNWLGLSVAAVRADDRQGTRSVRRAKFDADVTYVTGQELAFTYLYDNSASCRSPGEQVGFSGCGSLWSPHHSRV